MIGNTHRTTVRVYYEDTDFSGRVYHASYIRFFERGRTEWLRAIGFDHNQFAAQHSAAFAVTRLQTDFVAAAFMDDLLEVVTELTEIRGAVLFFRQTIERERASLTIATVEVVAIRDNRAIRPPREIVARLRPKA